MIVYLELVVVVLVEGGRSLETFGLDSRVACARRRRAPKQQGERNGDIKPQPLVLLYCLYPVVAGKDSHCRAANAMLTLLG